MATEQTQINWAPDRHHDWDHLVRICFENREANIGAFVRQHLIGADPRLLGQTLGQIVADLPAALREPKERVVQFEQRSLERFNSVVEERTAPLPNCGFWYVSALIDGEIPEHEATQDFLRRLGLDMPAHSGWTPWAVMLSCPTTDIRPYTFEGVWEQFVLNSDWSMHLDFWRIDPAGHFFHMRALEDDFVGDQRNVQPGTQLDFDIAVWRVTEVLSILLSLGDSMGCTQDDASIHCRFVWTGLAGQTLAAWSNPSRLMRMRPTSRTDECAVPLVLPLSTPRNGLAPYVERAVRPLFASFEGFSVQPRIIEGLVANILAQRC